MGNVRFSAILDLYSLNLRSQGVQALVNILIPALDLVAVVDDAGAVGGEGGINNIAVDPGFRRSGVGTALLSGLIRAGTEEGLSRLCLEVRASNTAAVSLYEKNGFHRVGARRGYYTAPKEDAVLFDKDL